MEAIPESTNQLSADTNVEEARIRRPPNAFMLFGKQYRRVLAQKFDKLSNKQISKILGDEWKKMEPTMKTHFHSLAKEAYQSHLQKYPDYHYNPLEARLRKAERKRKYKTSRVSHKSKGSSQFVLPVIKPFGGNRSIAFPNTTFGFSQPLTVPYIQPIVNSGTGDSVIGIKRLNNSFKASEVVSREVTPIEHKEHNYSFQPKIEESVPQHVITYEIQSEQQFTECEIQSQQNMDQMDWNQSFDFYVNFLPPMLNLSSEATPVFQVMDQSYSQDLNERIDCQSDKPEFNANETNEEEMSDNTTLVGQPMDVLTFIKTEIKSEPIDEQYEQLFTKEPKVVVQRIPQ